MNKDTKGKRKWNLINLKDIEGIVRVREFGTKKYKDPENWKLVPPLEYVAAIKRHLVAIDNEGLFSVDEESGEPHISHIGCNGYFLSYFHRMYKEAEAKHGNM